MKYAVIVEDYCDVLIIAFDSEAYAKCYRRRMNKVGVIAYIKTTEAVCPLNVVLSMEYGNKASKMFAERIYYNSKTFNR